MSEITCKLTGDIGKGVDSHIVPRAFLDLGSYEAPSVTIGSKPESYPKRTPIGWYDKTIVTQKGEKILSELDDYAAKILIHSEDQFRDEFFDKGEALVKTLDTYDYKKLELFALSVAWRASTSSLEVMKTIKLGPHENIIGEILISQADIPADLYAVNIFKFKPSPLSKVQINPVMQRFEQVNYCNICVPPYTLLIKMDNRKTPSVFSGWQLSAMQPLRVVLRDFSGSNEERVLKEMAEINKHKMPGHFKTQP